MLSLSFAVISGLFLASALTSTISAITGMAGGVLLFSFMTVFMGLETLIPIHGLVQLGSNASRLYYLRGHTLKEMVISFGIGAVLGATGATWLKTVVSIDPKYPISVVIVLILYVLFKPKKLPEIMLPFKGYVIVGLLAGFLGIFIGTVGPFIAVFFVRSDLTKEQVISNKAFMQAMIHILKIPAFLYLGFDFIQILPLSLLMIAASIIGSKYGVKILEKIEYKIFYVLFRACLFLGACRLSYKVLFWGSDQ